MEKKPKIDPKYLQKIESKKMMVEPRLRSLAQLADRLGLSFKDFMLQLFGDGLKDTKDGHKKDSKKTNK